MAYAPAANLTTTGSIAHYPTVWYNRRGLHKLTKRFRFYNCCEPDMIPQRSGKTVQFFRYTQLSANVTPAGEGAVGTSNTLTSTTVSGSVSEYQDFITVSTLLVETIIDPVVTNAAELLGYSAGLSVDTIIRTAADGQSAAVLSPGTLGTTASVNDLRRCKAILEATDVPPKDDKYYYSVIH